MSNNTNTVTVTITTSTGSPSTCVDGDGAQDYDVTLTVGDVSVEGEVTLCVDHEGNLSPWGSLDNWLSSSLCDVVRSLDRDDSAHSVERARLIEAIVSACTGDSADVTVEIDCSSIALLAHQGATEEVNEMAQGEPDEDGVPVALTSEELYATVARGYYANDGAINAGAADVDKVPEIFHAVYYAAWADAGLSVTRELAADRALEESAVEAAQ